MDKKVAIIGAGFSGLSAATLLSHKGFNVEVFEKNEKPGGRARNFASEGYTFDMGPTWYWFPDVFERFFAQFNTSVSDLYTLKRLDPSYRIFFSKNEFIDVPANGDALYALFESIEAGSSQQLEKFLSEAEYKYTLAIDKILHKPSYSILEYFEPGILKGFFKLDILKSLSKSVRQLFKDIRLIRILEFPVIFLGAAPNKTPALYSLMNYADLILGTWYPEGGMYSVVEGFYNLAQSFGVKFHFNSEVQNLRISNSYIADIQVNGTNRKFDYVIGSGDYYHIESKLLEKKHQSYSENYWESRTMAPSSLLFYLGINKKLNNLQHHNLLFDSDFEKHTDEIYSTPKWPSDPALYVACSSKTDEHAAPEGHENVIVLIPVAPGLQDDMAIKEYYFKMVIRRLEKITGQSIKENIVYKRSYAYSDFIKDYYAFKGNAYGMANTLRQTAFLKPKIKSKKINNLFYAGQLTVPGPGVPPAIISGEIAAREIIRMNL
ncbi:MAG: phytoene desaturase [Bacteroidales bacterium]|nr:phytoene desaturase [Bacteroidales bacterium]